METKMGNAWFAVLACVSMLGCAASHERAERADASFDATDAMPDASTVDASTADAFVCGDLGSPSTTLRCSVACGGCAPSYECLDPCELAPSLPQCAEPSDVGLCMKRCVVGGADCWGNEVCVPDPRVDCSTSFACYGYCSGVPRFGG